MKKSLVYLLFVSIIMSCAMFGIVKIDDELEEM